MALYAYARVRTGRRDEAESAVRGFLDFIRSAKVGYGQREHRDRLRAFLLSAFQDYLEVEGLRGFGGSAEVSQISFDAADEWLGKEKDVASPEAAFRRAWARCVFLQSCAQLREELAANLGSPVADLIASQLSPTNGGPSTREIALKLSISAEEALDMLRSAKRRLRELLFNTIRETVSSTPDVEVEFWDLFKSVDR